MLQAPPSLLIPYFQINTMDPPQIIPARAPCQLERLQKRARRTTGPNTAPKPAQAKDTMLNTELFGSRAINMATTAMRSNVTLSATMLSFFVSLSLRILPRRSEDTAEDAARSWESAVDIVEARIPARMIPARIAASTPC